MTPTMKLRFVNRVTITPIVGTEWANRCEEKILQQWWEPEDSDNVYGSKELLAMAEGEWRDVEVANE